jgi:hypothetical protein
MTARGIRNNNPGNIRIGQNWVGERVGTDTAFEEFETPAYGVRALARILKTYYNKYSLRTIEAIIARWAPPNENDTPAYVRAVANGMAVSPTAELTFPAQLAPLVAGIIRHENGEQPYDMADLRKWVEL